MAFLYSVIGDNTKENREWLENVGYQNISEYKTECLQFLDCDNFDNTFFTFNNSKFGGKYTQILLDLDYINCIGNPQLFKAVTAMMDDSDYMQWFTDGNIWVLCNQSDFRYEVSIPSNIVKDVHKATLSELKEHFQRV